MMIRSFYWKPLVLMKRNVWLREARRAEFVEHIERSSYRKIRSFYTMIRSLYNVIRSFYNVIRSFYTLINTFYMMICSFYGKRLVFGKKKVWLPEACRAEFVEHRESNSYRMIRSLYAMIRSFYNVIRRFYKMIRSFYTMIRIFYMTIRNFYWKRLVFKKRDNRGKQGPFAKQGPREAICLRTC
jgi:hypothetical protein